MFLCVDWDFLLAVDAEGRLGQLVGADEGDQVGIFVVGDIDEWQLLGEDFVDWYFEL